MYLEGPRFTFAGDFHADTSTVNNDVRHYDNASFERRFQEPPDGDVLNGWWNPSGGSTLDLHDCTVRSAWTPEDGPLTTDPIFGATVAGPSDRSSAKMIDIDPQAQMYTQLWGITLVVSDADGATLLRGDLKTPSFRDLQPRQFDTNGQPNSLPNGQPNGASWTSVLQRVEWGDISRSAVLRALRETTDDDKLAVNLTAFGFYYAHADGRFGLGRMLGTVGPYVSGEPEFFALGRRLVAPQGPTPPIGFSYSNAYVDPARRFVTVDLGGSFPLVDSMGSTADVDLLQLAVASDQRPPLGNIPRSDDWVVIGDIDHSDDGWLVNSSGIVTLSVPEEARELIDDHQLVLISTKAPGTVRATTQVRAAEPGNGLFVRADEAVHRYNCGDPDVTVEIYAAQWGRPAAGRTIGLALARPSRDGGGPGTDPNPPTAMIPYTNNPASALSFPASVVTDQQGRAEITIAATDPGQPRQYVDGQIYQLNYTTDGLTGQYPLDQIVVHVRTAFESPEHPTWADIEPTMTQYGNLYPLMSRFISDLSDHEAVLAKRDILIHAFQRAMEATDHMPAQRDLSPGKLTAILRWLNDPRFGEASVPTADGEPVTPDESEFDRPAAIEMSRLEFDALTAGGGGKADALLGAAPSIDIIDSD